MGQHLRMMKIRATRMPFGVAAQRSHQDFRRQAVKLTNRIKA
jgi:hypothetical protein